MRRYIPLHAQNKNVQEKKGKREQKDMFRHKRRVELDELSGRITGRLGYIGPQRCTPDQRPLLRHRADGPADVQRWIHTYGDRGPRAPGAPEVMTPTCAAGDRTRSAEVCYTAGLNNAGCAIRLRHQAKEERRGPDPSWSRWKAETTAARSVTGRD